MNSKYNILKFIFEEHAKEANGVSAELLSSIADQSDIEFLIRNGLIKSHLILSTLLVYYPTDCYSNYDSEDISLAYAYYMRYTKKPVKHVIINESDYEIWIRKNKESLDILTTKSLYKNERLYSLSNEPSEAELSNVRLVRGYSSNCEVSEFVRNLELEIEVCFVYIKMKFNKSKDNSELIKELEIEYMKIYLFRKTINYLKPYACLKIKDVL